MEGLGLPTLHFSKYLHLETRCPHCSIPNAGFAQWWTSAGVVPRGSPGTVHKWVSYFCKYCGGGILAKGVANDSAESAGIIERIPTPKAVHEDVPEPARTYLHQAMETLHAPDAAAVMAG